MSRLLLLVPFAALIVSCGENAEPAPTNVANDAAPVETAAETPAPAPAPPAAPEPRTPPAPGEPGGLPDDRTPISEAPFTADSAQGAANVVQTYYALLEQGKYDEARKLWSDGGRASGLTAVEFAASFDKYSEYHANIGAPGRIEGAAGSLYVEVPVQVYGRLKSGGQFNMLGPVKLRRVNNVPGATEEQLKWHIFESGVRPRPAG